MRTVTGNFEDERRKFGDPVAHNRWFIFILAFVKQHSLQLFNIHVLKSSAQLFFKYFFQFSVEGLEGSK